MIPIMPPKKMPMPMTMQQDTETPADMKKEIAKIMKDKGVDYATAKKIYMSMPASKED